MKSFCFDPEIAKRYGVDAAVMLWNLDFWIQKNKANGKFYYLGRYWTYNSAAAFAELFPFWTQKQITRILSKLEDAGVILSGNWNDNQYDRTKWYAIDYAVLNGENANPQTGKCISPNGQMDFPERENGFPQTGNPIPDSNTDIIADVIEIGDNARETRSPRGTSESKNCLFIDSRFADFDAFAEQFKGDDYAGVDIRYYYEAVKNWSASNGAKKKDWIATAKNWMHRDHKEGKLVRIQNTGNPGGMKDWQYKDSLLQHSLDDAELWPGL